jgi:hypothetical protein
MPYRMIMINKEDKKTVIEKLAFDNPNSEFKFEDKTIFRKGMIICKKIEKYEDIKKCYIEHY